MRAGFTPSDYTSTAPMDPSRKIGPAGRALATMAVLGCAASAQADALSGLEAPFQNAVASGSWGGALGMMFLAGVATSLTPCVYPMIAITVGVFGAQQQSRGRAALLSTAFVLGIAVLFTPLGLVAATTGGLFGSALSNPVVLILLASVFLALAASMFGLFDLDLPSGLKTRLARVGGIGMRGAFALGLVSALLAAPCTGPVLAFLLTWVGATGNLLFGAAGLFVYALGLGLLFGAVGTFSVSLPKSGQWLEWTKSALGIVMVVAAFYYIRDLIPGFRELAERSAGFLAVVAATALCGLWLGAIHLSFHGSSRRHRIRKGLGVLLMSLGLLGVVGYLEALPPGAKISWLDDYASAKALALSQGRPLLVDFSASWCGACGELDRHTFSQPRVVREAARFVAVRVDLSPGQDTSEKRAALAAYNQRGLPLVVLHDKTGQERARFTGFVTADAFLKTMRKVH